MKILSYLDACSSKIRLLENLFDSVTENLPSDLHMEVIDLQSSGIVKDKFKEGNLIEFYKCLPYASSWYLGSAGPSSAFGCPSCWGVVQVFFHHCLHALFTPFSSYILS